MAKASKQAPKALQRSATSVDTVRGSTHHKRMHGTLCTTLHMLTNSRIPSVRSRCQLIVHEARNVFLGAYTDKILSGITTNEKQILFRRCHLTWTHMIKKTITVQMIVYLRTLFLHAFNCQVSYPNFKQPHMVASCPWHFVIRSALFDFVLMYIRSVCLFSTMFCASMYFSKMCFTHRCLTVDMVHKSYTRSRVYS